MADGSKLDSIDKVRGLVLGFAAGEALGRPIDGVDRDAILVRHGRVTHLLGDAAPGRLTEQFSAHARSAQGVRELQLSGAPIRALTAQDPTAAGETLRSDAAEAASILEAVSRVAFATPCFDPLSAQRVIDAVRDVARSYPARDAIGPLTEQAMSPPAPSAASAPFEKLSASLLDALLVTHTLLVRTHSVQDAIVYAVNLGGPTALRGALCGAIAGLHRSGACVPERWLATADLGALEALAADLAKIAYV